MLTISDSLGTLAGAGPDYAHLGKVYQSLGNGVQAEVADKKALEINKASSNNEGMADAYGNLGLVYRTCGDFVQAEAAFYVP